MEIMTTWQRRHRNGHDSSRHPAHQSHQRRARAAAMPRFYPLHLEILWQHQCPGLRG